MMMIMRTMIHSDDDETKTEKLRKRFSLLSNARMSLCCEKKH